MDKPERGAYSYWLSIRAGKSHEEALKDEVADAPEMNGSRKAVPLIDKLLTNGEGTLDSSQFPDDDDDTIWMYTVGHYQWIRVYEDKPGGRAIATFYLHTLEGELRTMFVARARKKMPPNPEEYIPLWHYRPWTVAHFYEDPSDPLRADVFDGREDSLEQAALGPDYVGAQGVKGLRPTLGVRMIRSIDNDHRWQFPGFKVRSTVLAPVLLKLRGAGVQRVPLNTLIQAVELHQTATSGP